MVINSSEFRRWWDIFHGEQCQLVELRLLGRDGNRKVTKSGYFMDVNKALAALQTEPALLGVYAPINSISSDCYGRAQHDKLLASPDTTTNDNNIVGRDWLLIDLDAKRAAGCNTTDDELAAAKQVMLNVGIFLRDQGFSAPVVAMSGNGYHMYYKVHLKNDDDNVGLLKRFLSVLDMYFSSEGCDVDCSVYNASRIAKVIGTQSVKGADTEDRPQRMSCFIKVPAKIEDTDKQFIEKVAAMYPEEEKPDRYNNYRTEFNIEDFISKHGIRVARRQTFSGGTKLILEECPFDSNHRAPDSAIFVMNSGAIAFKCLHNSCSGYSWRDVRMKFEPDAYDRYYVAQTRARQVQYSSLPKQNIIPETSGAVWQKLSEVEWLDPSKQTYIPSGFVDLDRKMGGWAAGDVTLLSGLSAAGKTTIINTVALNAVQRGYKVAIWSGEMQASRFQSWIDQTAAGKNYVVEREGYDSWYYCPKNIAGKINRWLDGKLWLRNNDFGSHWSSLMNDITDIQQTEGIQLVILDNLASLSLDNYDGDKNERQSQFIRDVKNYAKKANIHVILVVHPRKEQMNQLLRMESISGTFDLVNLSDNVILAHRVGRDFVKRACEFWGDDMITSLEMYHEVLEVAKNRSHGSKDLVVGLYYEPKSRRFQNSFDEHVVYGWQEDMIPVEPYPQIPESRVIDNDDDPLGPQLLEIPF